jgi:MFS family permease
VCPSANTLDNCPRQAHKENPGSGVLYPLVPLKGIIRKKGAPGIARLQFSFWLAGTSVDSPYPHIEKGEGVAAQNTKIFIFIATISLMGVSTFLVGVLPPYSTLGIAAPIILVVLRILQGLAVGGEYGGAIIYVGEHSPDDRRGLYTGLVQCASPAGLLLSLVVIFLSRLIVGDKRFEV